MRVAERTPMRRLALLTLLALAGPGVDAKSAAPSCQDLQSRRAVLLEESKLATANVEAKNVELGEAADAAKAATDEKRKAELERRADGLRRELTALLDREHATTDELGALDAEIAKRCRKGGRK